MKTSELREGHQTIAILAGGMAVLIIGMTTFVMVISARTYTPRQIATNLLIAAAWVFGFYAVLLLIHFLQHVETRADAVEARRTAQYEKFLALLRDVKWSLLNR
jgi:Zn-dependent protease with chaperone function